MGITFLFYILMSAMGMVLMKLGTGNTPLELSLSNGGISFKIGVLSFIGLMCYVFSFLLYMYLISKNKISVLIPLTSAIVTLLMVIAAVVIFKEKITLWQIVGIAFVLVGVFLTNYKA